MPLPPALEGMGMVVVAGEGWMIILFCGWLPGMTTLGAACPFSGAPTARSHRWPGWPWGGLTPVTGAAVLAGCVGAAVTAGRLAGAVALFFFEAEPALQAVNTTDAISSDPINWYMVNDLGVNDK